jgi:hypothetical protein
MAIIIKTGRPLCISREAVFDAKSTSLTKTETIHWFDLRKQRQTFAGLDIW